MVLMQLKPANTVRINDNVKSARGTDGVVTRIDVIDGTLELHVQTAVGREVWVVTPEHEVLTASPAHRNQEDERTDQNADQPWLPPYAEPADVVNGIALLH